MGNNISEERRLAPAQLTNPDSRTPAHLGQRVVRGPAWKWDSQDGGNGHVGTLIIVEQPWSEEIEESPFCVRVLWDNGKICNYRASPSRECDLRLFDSGPTGVKFPTTICDICYTNGIVGTRWKCDVCFDYDLCHTCYMSDKHDLTHAFLRFDEPGAVGVKVPPRKGSIKVEVHGIFEGAKVSRGTHWRWENQDGGDGKIGTVHSISNWGAGTERSEACVRWLSDTTVRSYRIGHHGYVDLKYTVPASGGHFYRDHMPLIAPVKIRSDRSLSGGPEFCEGDRIAITLDVECFKPLQNGHGGWNPLMEKIINQMGTVQNVDHNGDVRVSFGSAMRWTVNPAVLVKVPVFALGDVVTVMDDEPRVRRLQEGHGSFVDAMKMCLGETGTVIKLFRTHDVLVFINGTVWTFNPLCLTLFARHSEAADLSSTFRELASGSGISDQAARDVLRRILSSSLRTPDVSSANTSSRYRAGQKVKICNNKERVKRLQEGHGSYNDSMDAYLGRVGKVEAELCGNLFIKFSDGASWCYNPECVEPVDSSDESANDKHLKELEELLQLAGLRTEQRTTRVHRTKKIRAIKALHDACVRGNADVVKMMAETGADLEEEDEEGDRALHYAAYGEQPNIIDLLLTLGVDVNATNKKRVTALHIAVNKENVNCVRTLIEKSSERLDVNTQDDEGDTSLHDAIKHESLEITGMLLDFPTVDFTIQNKSGYNALHQAAASGNNVAVERILFKRPDLVDDKDTDGYAAIHLAAAAEHYSVAKTLVTQGKCTIDLKNKEERTALWIAAFSGSCEIVELLHGAGADINTTDEDGDTPLHITLMKQSDMVVQSLKESEAPAMSAIVKELSENPQPGVDSSLALACFLASRGADLHRKNKKGMTPLEMARSTAVIVLLLTWRTKKASVTTAAGSTASPVDAGNAESRHRICKICLESDADVCFEPCGHQLYCSECCRRMKCCLECSVQITGRVATGGSRQDHRELEARLQQLEEVYGCSICMERQRNVVFQCGHGACSSCAAGLTDCHMCRKAIEKKITIF